MRTTVLSLLFAVMTFAGDLASIAAEPNLERRSDRALDNADQAITAARDAYLAGNTAGAKAALEEVAASVDLSQQSLTATGKSARRNPKYFKRAEMRIREMLRRLNSLENDFDASDRSMVLHSEEHLAEVRDELLNGIMSKKK